MEPDAEAEKYNLAGNCALKDHEYDKAIQKCPKEARYISNRSAAYLGSGDRTRALNDAEQVVSLMPTWYKGYCRVASVYLRLKKYKDCIEYCKLVINLDKDNEAALHILTLADKATSGSKAEDFSALDAALAEANDNISVEEVSRLKAIREEKKLEGFLSTVDEGLKPVIDTQKNRSVTNDAVESLSAIGHIERLTGKNSFWKNLNPYRVMMLPETASDEDIRQRYIAFAALIHPDKCDHPFARQALEAIMGANDILKDTKRRDECVKLITGATKSVLRNRQRLLEKGLSPDALPEEEVAIEEEVMRVFAQNEQRQRKARQYTTLYERRTKEKEEEKRQQIIDEVKLHREWVNTTDVRVNTWRKYQEKSKNKKRDVSADDLTGETDHDKRRRKEEEAYYTALGEEYKLKWR